MPFMDKPWLGFLTVVAGLLCAYLGIAGYAVGYEAYDSADSVLSKALYIAAGAAGLVSFCGFLYAGKPTDTPTDGSSAPATTAADDTH